MQIELDSNINAQPHKFCGKYSFVINSLLNLNYAQTEHTRMHTDRRTETHTQTHTLLLCLQTIELWSQTLVTILKTSLKLLHLCSLFVSQVFSHHLCHCTSQAVVKWHCTFVQKRCRTNCVFLCRHTNLTFLEFIVYYSSAWNCSTLRVILTSTAFDTW